VEEDQQDFCTKGPEIGQYLGSNAIASELDLG